MFSRVLLTRIVNVFVASTFDDLQAERTILRRQTDRLKKSAGEYGIKFSQFVDLRWGISDAQVQSGKLLQLCLRAVDMCVPFFVGIIGGRNGNAVKPAWLHRLKELYPFWSDAAIEMARDFSVTEVEIWHALRNRQRPETPAVFFALRPEGIARPIPYGPEVRRLLAGQQVVPFEDADGLATGICDELDRRLQDYARGKETQAQRERAPFTATQEHDFFAAARRYGYNGDSKVGDIAAWIDKKPECYLVVTGAVGIGKSSFVAMLAQQLIEWPTSRPVFLHFCSLDDVAADLDNLLKRMIEEIARYVGEADTDSTLSLSEKARRLPSWLERAGIKARREKTVAVFLIDGLDQLKRASASEHLESEKPEALDPYNWAQWLPIQPPAGTIIVLTYRSGEGKKIGFRDPRPTIHESIEPLSDAKRIKILERALRPRKLEAKFIDELINQGSPGSRSFTGSPLFLNTVADELKATDNRDQIPDKVAELANATGFVALFREALNRMEKDFHEALPQAEAKLFVRLLGLIASSRRGLSRDDLIALSVRGNILLEEAGTAWDLASVLLQKYLIQRDDRFFFSHEEFHAAVDRKLAAEANEIAKECRAALAKYFFARWQQVQRETARTDSELPWTIDQELPEALLETIKDGHSPGKRTQAAEWLLAYLTDPRTRLRRCGVSLSESYALYGRIFSLGNKRKNTAAWKRFWHRLDANLAKSKLADHEQGKILLHLGKVLNVINENERGLFVAERAIRLYRGNPTRRLATLLAGDIAREQSSYKKALTFYQQASRAASRDQAREVRSQAYFGIARIHRLHGRHRPSLVNYQCALDTIKDLPDSSADKLFHLPWCHFGLGEIHRLLGQFEDSAKHYKAAKLRFEKMNDPRGIAYAAWGQGELARLKGQFGEAERLYQDSEDLCKTIHDRRGIAWARLGFAEIERAQFHRHSESERCEQAIEHCRNLIDDGLLPLTERYHAELQLAECYRLYSVLDRSHVAAARRSYKRCRAYYKKKQMSYCIELADDGLAMLDRFCARDANTAQAVGSVEPHPITLP